MKIETFLICDDIRNEIGNKNSLIGVYDQKILFNATPETSGKWPKHLKLGIYTKINFEGLKPDNFKVKSKYNENEKKLVLTGKMAAVGENDKMNIAMVTPNFIFEGPGGMQFSFEFYSETEELLESIDAPYLFEVE